MLKRACALLMVLALALFAPAIALACAQGSGPQIEMNALAQEHPTSTEADALPRRHELARDVSVSAQAGPALRYDHSCICSGGAHCNCPAACNGAVALVDAWQPGRQSCAAQYSDVTAAGDDLQLRPPVPPPRG